MELEEKFRRVEFWLTRLQSLALDYLGKQFAFGVGCFSDSVLWKTRSGARIN